ADWQGLVKRFKKAVKERTGHDFPDDAYEQMWGAVAAVFNSWGNDRAVVYRRQYGYPHDWGTAANICSMVFGNMGDDCCTGVAFSPVAGSRVKATPVQQSSPILPKTIEQMLAAVPHSWGKPYGRRETTARSFIHEPTTAAIV